MAKATQIQVLTFRLPLGNTGRMAEPQSRMLIESVHQYRVAINPRMQSKFVEDKVRKGEKLLVNSLGGWYPMNDQVDVLDQEVITVYS